jgi:hypothetical protein
MRVAGDQRPKHVCPHCNGRKVCGCDNCVQQGGICGTCNEFGYLLVVSPALPPGFHLPAEAKAGPLPRRAARRGGAQAARRAR